MRLIDADAFIEKLAPVPMVQEAIRSAIDTIPTVEVDDGWIPVSEHLPKKNGFYIVTLNNSYTDFCLWEDKKGFGMLGTRWYPCEEVTAWRDLPKPYESKESET